MMINGWVDEGWMGGHFFFLAVKWLVMDWMRSCLFWPPLLCRCLPHVEGSARFHLVPLQVVQLHSRILFFLFLP
jgi:hypothetical protein